MLVQSNRIVHLPEEIGSLARLKTLDVSNNDLAELPAALGYLPELHRLVVDGNPLRAVRRSLLSGGASSLKVCTVDVSVCSTSAGLLSLKVRLLLLLLVCLFISRFVSPGLLLSLEVCLPCCCCCWSAFLARSFHVHTHVSFFFCLRWAVIA